MNHSFVFGTGGVISTANDLATGRVLNAKYQRLWFDSLQPEDLGKPNGQSMGTASLGLVGDGIAFIFTAEQPAITQSWASTPTIM